jgi:molybdenum cofactor guanylyltransferase
MIGLVLCGGNSSRMGKDKGLLLRNNITWASHAYNLLKQFAINTYISINVHQQVQYSLIFNPALCIVDEAIPVHGPILGLLSTHIKYPTEDILVLACDMPCMQVDAITYLLTHYDNHSLVYTNNKHVEPLCGIYNAPSLAYILKHFSVGEDTTPIAHFSLDEDAKQTAQHAASNNSSQKIKKHSMMHCLSLMNAKYIEIPEAYKPYFVNINSANDMLF